jgi:hypothetical protein
MTDTLSSNEVDSSSSTSPSFVTALVAGGLAGTSVDVALFPIDTLKTRLQSPQGFLKAGGFRGIYNGLGAAAVGSAPGAALFFSTYEVSDETKNKNETQQLHIIYYIKWSPQHTITLFHDYYL